MEKIQNQSTPPPKEETTASNTNIYRHKLTLVPATNIGGGYVYHFRNGSETSRFINEPQHTGHLDLGAGIYIIPAKFYFTRRGAFPLLNLMLGYNYTGINSHTGYARFGISTFDTGGLDGTLSLDTGVSRVNFNNTDQVSHVLFNRALLGISLFHSIKLEAGVRSYNFQNFALEASLSFDIYALATILQHFIK